MEERQEQAEEQAQVTNEDQANQQDQQTTPTVKELLEQQEEKFKKELAGLNKTVSKLEKEKESLAMEKLTETERAEAEKLKAIEEAKSIKAETASLRRERDLTKVLFKSGLDPEVFGSRIKGDTLEEMEADSIVLKTEFNKAVEAKIEKEIARRLSGNKPEGGDPAHTLSSEEAVARARKISSGR